jgi:hypothetical protein
MADAVCPICGKVYKIPGGKGRWMIGNKFLDHKDGCTLPCEDEFVQVGSRVGVVTEVIPPTGRPFPRFNVQFPSGREDVFNAHEVERYQDQESGRRRFYR